MLNNLFIAFLNLFISLIELKTFPYLLTCLFIFLISLTELKTILIITYLFFFLTYLFL